jgi:hypothetical protein
MERTTALDGKLWQRAMAVGTVDPHSIPAGLFVQTLNQMSDLQETRLARGATACRLSYSHCVTALPALRSALAALSGLGGKGRRMRSWPF